MRKLKALFHPIFIFVGVQVAWIVLMAVWINWYIKNNRKFQEFAQKIRPDLFADELNWLILLEGCLLMLIILAGVYIIFVYWNKQARLNRLQSNFVSSVSHELKSPLASIQLYLETMKYQKVSKEDAADFVEIMLTDTERLASLINNILESSKYDPKKMQFQFQSVNLGAFLREVVGGLKRQFEERNCKVKLEIKEDYVLSLDRRAMQMVFNNLIGNALRYSPIGAPLTIRLQKKKKFCEIDFIDLEDDLSTNCWWVGLIAYGEGWHNNHHAFPKSAKHGLRLWEVDMTWMAICVLRFLGLAKDIKVAKLKSQTCETTSQKIFTGEIVEQAA